MKPCTHCGRPAIHEAISFDSEGAAAGTFFCFRYQNPMKALVHVRNSGMPFRMET
jgi:hypothetical protein